MNLNDKTLQSIADQAKKIMDDTTANLPVVDPNEQIDTSFVDRMVAAGNSTRFVKEEAERPYVCVHTKKGRHECTATSSYGAAQKAAAKWGLKSTAGVTAHLADVKHTAVDEAVEDLEEGAKKPKCKNCGMAHSSHILSPGGPRHNKRELHCPSMHGTSMYKPLKEDTEGWNDHVETQAPVDIKVRSEYAQKYAKSLTKHMGRNPHRQASAKAKHDAYVHVANKFGQEIHDKLKQWHDDNASGKNDHMYVKEEKIGSCPSCGHGMKVSQWEKQPKKGDEGDDAAVCPHCGAAEGWHEHEHGGKETVKEDRIPAHPLRDHAFHSKSNHELHFIMKDAGEARKNMEDMGNDHAAGKYADQVNDAATVLYHRKTISDNRGKLPDWYQNHYKPHLEESMTSALHAINPKHDNVLPPKKEVKPKTSLVSKIKNAVKKVIKEETVTEHDEKHAAHMYHGGPWDRGAADAYYHRDKDPHKYPAGTYNGERVKLTDPSELAAYHHGYDTTTDRKQWDEGVKSIDLEPVLEEGGFLALVGKVQKDGEKYHVWQKHPAGYHYEVQHIDSRKENGLGRSFYHHDSLHTLKDKGYEFIKEEDNA